jgi:hypothetical protein
MPTFNSRVRLRSLQQALAEEACLRRPPSVTVAAPRLDPRPPCRQTRQIRRPRQDPTVPSASPMISSPPCYAPPSPWRSATGVPSCKTWPRPFKAKSSATERCTGQSHKCSGATTIRRSLVPSRGGDVNFDSRAARTRRAPRACLAQCPAGARPAIVNEVLRVVRLLRGRRPTPVVRASPDRGANRPPHSHPDCHCRSDCHATAA